MPRNVRNFWIELDVDGRKARIATGPRRRDGGFECVIRMREAGYVTRVLQLRGSESDGLLTLTVGTDDHGVIFKRRTRRE